MPAAVFSPPASNAGQSGPIRSYPAGPSMPVSVAALGEPQHVHRYQSFAEQCGLGWLVGSAAGKHPTYLSYREALAVVTPQTITVIPWDEITDFLHTVGFKASSGERYFVGPDFTDYFPLYMRFQNEILANFLPKALIAIEEGKEWVFRPLDKPTAGELGVSAGGIRYKNQQLGWDDVANIHLTKHTQNGALYGTTLSVRKNYSLFATITIDFRTMPNSFLLTELLPYVCPQRLLVKK